MKRILLAALFFLATFARFYAIDSIGLHDWDVGWMISNAKNLLRPNHHITSHFGTSVIFAFTRLFSESDTAVLVTVALFDLAILALTFSFANRFFSFWVAFFSVLFLSLFPTYTFFVKRGLHLTFATFFTILAIYATAKYVENPGRKVLLFATGVNLFVAFLCHTSTFVYPVLLVLSFGAFLRFKDFITFGFSITSGFFISALVTFFLLDVIVKANIFFGAILGHARWVSQAMKLDYTVASDWWRFLYLKLDSFKYFFYPILDPMPVYQAGAFCYDPSRIGTERCSLPGDKASSFFSVLNIQIFLMLLILASICLYLVFLIRDKKETPRIAKHLSMVCLGAIGILFFWHNIDITYRNFMPVFPLFCVLVVYGLDRMVRRLVALKWRTGVVATLALAFVLWGIVINFRYGDTRTPLRDLYDFAKANPAQYFVVNNGRNENDLFRVVYHYGAIPGSNFGALSGQSGYLVFQEPLLDWQAQDFGNREITRQLARYLSEARLRPIREFGIAPNLFHALTDSRPEKIYIYKLDRQTSRN